MIAGAAVIGVLAGMVAAAPAGAVTPPDARSYELVSPPQKHGGDVLINSMRTWAAGDGDAVAFASLTGFGDVQGTGLATDYLATRVSGDPPAASQGWTVHAITPPLDALPASLVSGGFEPMDEAFNASLDAGVFQSFDPLTADPNVSNVVNLYLRRGFRTASTPSIELATGCPNCALSGPLSPFAWTRFNMLPRVAGLSADGTHVLFESTLRLTGDATDGTSSGQINLYEYADGTVKNVGILPDGRPAAGAVAGQGTNAGQVAGVYTPRALSSDGTRVVFTAAPASCAIGLSNYTCGALYLRDISTTPASTLQVNASERTPADPAGAQPATFWAASTDGQRVFFTTTEQLTNDTNSNNNNLYVFDASAPAGSRLTRISVQDPSRAGAAGADVDIVLGASDDGRTVYFSSSEPLLPGDPSFAGDTEGIYVWRDAGSGPPQLRFVAPLHGFTGNKNDNRVAGSVWTLGGLVQSRVSQDGRFLLFSTTNGTGLLSLYGQRDYDHGACNDVGVSGCREFYLYDADATTPETQLQCASCRPDGATATTSASDVAQDFIGGASSAGIFDHALSTDGRVFFSTSETLVPEDVNGRSDAYEWENGHAHLLTDGQSPNDSFFLDASPDGSDVFVDTRARLTAWDIDDSYDLYDVRQPLPGHPAGVGDPPIAPPSCAPGEGCRGPLLQPPPLTPVPTITFAGSGNLKQTFPRPVHCRAGTVRKRTSRGIRCIRRPRRTKPVRCTRSKGHSKTCSKAPAHARKSGRARKSGGAR